MQPACPPSTAVAHQGAIPPGGLGAGGLSYTHKPCLPWYISCCPIVSGADFTESFSWSTDSPDWLTSVTSDATLPARKTTASAPRVRLPAPDACAHLFSRLGHYGEKSGINGLRNDGLCSIWDVGQGRDGKPRFWVPLTGTAVNGMDGTLVVWGLEIVY